MKMTKAQIAFLAEVKATGSTAGKWSVRESVLNRGLIERDRVEDCVVLFKLTAAGEAALSAAR